MAAGELMLAAAHNTDLDAAQRAGLATAFISRPTEHGPAQTNDLAPTGSWDILATSIVDLASQLSGQRCKAFKPLAYGARPHVPEATSDPADSTAGR